MRTNRLRELWRAGKPATMAWLSTADTFVAETLGSAGFDALVLDMQHGMTIGPDRAGLWLQAVGNTDAVPVVRVPWNEPVFIQWVLDAGAMGVIVPLVNNLEDASKAGGACRYPPQGFRSVGPNRVTLGAGGDYLQRANEEVVCLVMVENIQTVGRVEELAKAPGIDGFYIGPSDLAATMGVPPGSFRTSQEHARACQRVLDVARAHKLVAGIHCWDAQEAAQRQKQGFVFCPAMMDTSALKAQAEAALAVVRG